LLDSSSQSIAALNPLCRVFLVVAPVNGSAELFEYLIALPAAASLRFGVASISLNQP
jgi:hypothetical protein